MSDKLAGISFVSVSLFFLVSAQGKSKLRKERKEEGLCKTALHMHDELRGGVGGAERESESEKALLMFMNVEIKAQACLFPALLQALEQRKSRGGMIVSHTQREKRGQWPP